MPFLPAPICPPTRFVDTLTELPEDLDEYVLKPLYSLGGQGIEIAPSRQHLSEIDDPGRYLLQRRVEYASVVQTPHGPTRAEVRMMYLCGNRPMLTNTFVRLSRGSMMGVDFNKNAPWCGATLAYRPVRSV